MQGARPGAILTGWPPPRTQTGPIASGVGPPLARAQLDRGGRYRREANHGGSHRCDPAVGTVSGGRRERDLTGVDAAITDELAVESRRREV